MLSLFLCPSVCVCVFVQCLPEQVCMFDRGSTARRISEDKIINVDSFKVNLFGVQDPIYLHYNELSAATLHRRELGRGLTVRATTCICVCVLECMCVLFFLFFLALHYTEELLHEFRLFV